MAGEGGEGYAERLAAVRARIASACAAAGRDPAEITLLAVSKRHPDAAVRALAAQGLVDFGENLVQAWSARLTSLPDLQVRWHLIGPIQTNKAKVIAAGRPHLLHTLDRPALVDALEARLTGPPLDVLLQVNVDREPQKAGCLPEEADALADRVAASPALRLRGLMTIPRPSDEADPRPAFAALRGLGERLQDRIDPAGGASPILSMGMSDDLEAAIAEGSTLVRVGTALFGSRPT